MFLNIRDSVFMSIWLSLFLTKKNGEQKTPLNAPETMVVPPAPPFPRFIYRDTFGMYGNPGELAQ
jgi:hypothetical protein